jgi:hypothetical protein
LAGDPALLAGVQQRIERAELAAETAFSPAARLLRGTTPTHLALEQRLARFKGQEAALLFPSGYQANVGLLSALLRPQDRAISDAQNHASIIDGLRLSDARRSWCRTSGSRRSPARWRCRIRPGGPWSSSSRSTAWTAISRRSARSPICACAPAPIW